MSIASIWHAVVPGAFERRFSKQVAAYWVIVDNHIVSKQFSRKEKLFAISLLLLYPNIVQQRIHIRELPLAITASQIGMISLFPNRGQHEPLLSTDDYYCRDIVNLAMQLEAMVLQTTGTLSTDVIMKRIIKQKKLFIKSTQKTVSKKFYSKMYKQMFPYVNSQLLDPEFIDLVKSYEALENF